jgi:hypothetical protein
VVRVNGHGQDSVLPVVLGLHQNRFPLARIPSIRSVVNAPSKCRFSSLRCAFEEPLRALMQLQILLAQRGARPQHANGDAGDQRILRPELAHARLELNCPPTYTAEKNPNVLIEGWMTFSKSRN